MKHIVLPVQAFLYLYPDLRGFVLDVFFVASAIFEACHCSSKWRVFLRCPIWYLVLVYHSSILALVYLTLEFSPVFLVPSELIALRWIDYAVTWLGFGQLPASCPFPVLTARVACLNGREKGTLLCPLFISDIQHIDVRSVLDAKIGTLICFSMQKIQCLPRGCAVLALCS